MAAWLLQSSERAFGETGLKHGLPIYHSARHPDGKRILRCRRSVAGFSKAIELAGVGGAGDNWSAGCVELACEPGTVALGDTSRRYAREPWFGLGGRRFDV